MMQRRNVYWLVTVQWLVHFADEWFFGFPDWSTRHFGPFPGRPWVVGMGVLSAAMIALGWAASRPSAGARIRLVCAGLQMLFFSNGLFHLGATLVMGAYSPGTASGVVLYVPLSFVVWRAVRHEPGVTTGAFATALAAGFAANAFAVASLFVDKSGW